MKILFIGHFFPTELSKEVVKESRGTLNLSNHKFESVLVKGLSQQGIDSFLLTLPAVGYYPKFYKKLIIHKEIFEKNSLKGVSIGFGNIIFLKLVFKYFTGLIYALKWYNNTGKKEKRAIIVSTTDLDGLLIATTLKFIHRRLHLSIVIGDLPEFLALNEKYSGLIMRLTGMMHAMSMALLSRFDAFVIVTEAMKDKLPIGEKSYVVMEGAVDHETLGKGHKERKSSVLYTGSLRKIFGIVELLDAFQLIRNEDIELWICGAGEAEKEIRVAQESDKRIKYFGLVNVEKAVELQQEATVLVNPRTDEGEYTKYSFPSKTLEYMLSGTPVIMNRLPGIPDEYYNYVFVPENSTVNSLAEMLEYVFSLNPQVLIDKGKAAKDFVMKNKNSKMQIKKILDTIKRDLG